MAKREETAEQYQHRMLVAHLTAAKMMETQSAIYAFWEAQRHEQWNNQRMVDEKVIQAYDALQEAIQQIQIGLRVAHYG